ncbi:MAG: GNAT family N-acetyltransferase [Leptolyngbya sp. SIOISBB]|nr:GNAT family N-acetyltransferase [Leptolyngbya sp. SIOISBB]
MTTIAWPLRLETQRLVLRPIEPDDYQACWASTQARLPQQHPYDDDLLDLEELDADGFAQICEDHQAAALNDQGYNWSIFHKQTNQHLGKIDLTTIQRSVFQWANLGYGIHNQFWRQGFGKEAVTAALTAGFKQLHYHRIEAAINLDNQASIGLVQSIGLRQECIRRGFWFENEQWVDHLIFVALPSDLGLPEQSPLLG